MCAHAHEHLYACVPTHDAILPSFYLQRTAIKCKLTAEERRHNHQLAMQFFNHSNGVIIWAEINPGTQKLQQKVSFLRRHLDQDPDQCQIEISPRILENHCSAKPRCGQMQCPSLPSPHFEKGHLSSDFSFPFNLFSCQRDRFPPLPYSTAPPDWIPFRAPGGPVPQANLMEPFCLFHAIHLSGQLKLCCKM